MRTLHSFLIFMRYARRFNLLYEKADDVHCDHLPIHIRCFVDKTSNVDEIWALWLQFRIMTEKNFEKSEQRNGTVYETAYSVFRADMLRSGALLFSKDFGQKFSMEINFVLMMRKETKSNFLLQRKRTSTTCTTSCTRNSIAVWKLKTCCGGVITEGSVFCWPTATIPATATILRPVKRSRSVGRWARTIRKRRARRTAGLPAWSMTAPTID